MQTSSRPTASRRGLDTRGSQRAARLFGTEICAITASAPRSSAIWLGCATAAESPTTAQDRTGLGELLALQVEDRVP